MTRVRSGEFRISNAGDTSLKSSPVRHEYAGVTVRGVARLVGIEGGVVSGVFNLE